MGGLLFRIIPVPLYAHFTRQYNTTLLLSVNTIALGIFCGTKYTHHTKSCLFLYVGLVSSFLDFDVPPCRVCGFTTVSLARYRPVPFQLHMVL